MITEPNYRPEPPSNQPSDIEDTTERFTSTKRSSILLDEALDKVDEVIEMIESGKYVRITDHTSELYDQVDFLKQRLKAYFDHQESLEEM